MAMLVLAIDARSLHERAWIGLAFGVGFLAPGLFWMTEFSLPGWVLAMLLESVLVALAVAATPRRGWLALTLPSAFVLSDALRGAWPFGGVPIATLGQTQIGGPLLQAARLGGALLVAALVAAAGVALASLVDRRWATGAIVALAVVAITVVGTSASDGTRVGEL